MAPQHIRGRRLPLLLLLLLLVLAQAAASAAAAAALPEAPAPATAAFLAPTPQRRAAVPRTIAFTSINRIKTGNSAVRLHAVGDGGDDDLTERSLSLLEKLARGLNRELPVPTLLVPPRPDEAGSGSGSSKATTTIKGWFPLSMGLSLTLGNPVYPAALVGFLYLSRPTDAPDVAAAAAAAVVAGVVNPLVENFADATGLDDSFLGRLPFLLGAAATAYVLLQVLGEGKEAFVDAPRREEQARMPAAKAERDLKFFDVKMKNQQQPQQQQQPQGPSSEKTKAGGGGGNGGENRWRE